MTTNFKVGDVVRIKDNPEEMDEYLSFFQSLGDLKVRATDNPFDGNIYFDLTEGQITKIMSSDFYVSAYEYIHSCYLELSPPRNIINKKFKSYYDDCYLK